MAKADYKPKFNIGDTVFSKVSRQGSSEPSMCKPGEKLTVKKIEMAGSSYRYTCGYDNYEFVENELMTKEEYINTL